MTPFNKLELIARKTIKKNDEIYQTIDFLNKNLKDKNVVFGVTLKNDNEMEIHIYENQL